MALNIATLDEMKEHVRSIVGRGDIRIKFDFLRTYSAAELDLLKRAVQEECWNTWVNLVTRIKHWAGSPLLWWYLHLCGNGFGKDAKYGCKSYKHGAAGPSRVNVRHIEFHRFMETAVDLKATPTSTAGQVVVLKILRAKLDLELGLTLFK